MRNIWTIYLIFAIFVFSVADELRQKKLELIARAFRNLHIIKEKQKRKLRETSPTNIPVNYTTGKEDSIADEPIKSVDPDALVSTQGIKVGDSTSSIQIIKFHNFEVKEKTITFGVFFFFLKRPIVRKVIFRLGVTRNSKRIRTLDDETEAESVPTIFNIKYKI